MYRVFETLADPFAPGDTPPAPRVWPYLRQNLSPLRTAIGLSLVFTLIAASLEVWLIAYAGRLIDTLAATPAGEVWARHGPELLVVAILLLVLRPISHIAREATNDLGLRPNAAALFRWRAHEHVAQQSVGWFQNDLAGRTAARVMEVGQNAANAIYGLLNAIAYVGIYLIGVVVLMASTDPRLALPVLAWIGLYAVVMVVFIPRMERASEAFQEARSTLQGDLVDRFTNIDTVRLFSTQAAIDGAARPAFERLRSRAFVLQRYEVTLNLILTVLEGAILVGLVGYGILLWSQGAASLGLIAAALALSLKITAMMEWFMDAVWDVFNQTGALREALKTVADPLTVTDAPAARPFAFQGGAIAVRDLTHHYGRGAGGLDRLALDIAPGEKVGLVGRSGAGKSTFVNLLLRFFEFEGGRITVDGQDIRALTQDSLRAEIGMVTQQAALLHRSVRENIAMGRPDATEAEVVAAASLAEAHDFIPNLQDAQGRRGYAAHVGERGVKLSGGQRQRIALARVMLKDAPILILDEATSALDSEVEAAILGTLDRLMAGKTVIAIAHRPSTIAAMDRILVLDKGRIVEDGRHEDLLAAGGAYARLWARQSGGFLATEVAAQ